MLLLTQSIERERITEKEEQEEKQLSGCHLVTHQVKVKKRTVHQVRAHRVEHHHPQTQQLLVLQVVVPTQHQLLVHHLVQIQLPTLQRLNHVHLPAEKSGLVSVLQQHLQAHHQKHPLVQVNMDLKCQ